MILGEVPEVTAGVVAWLLSEGHRVRRIIPGDRTRRLSADCQAIDFTDATALRDVHHTIVNQLGTSVSGIINFLPMQLDTAGDSKFPTADDAEQMAEWSFCVLQEFADDLQTSAQNGGACLLNMTSLDGQFGMADPARMSMAAASTLGLTKTAAREWPDVDVRTIDTAPGIDANLLVARLIQELSIERDHTEVGITTDGRWTIGLERRDVHHDPDQRVIKPGDVILLTGGALGITADVARQLAEFQPRLILVGRTPLAEPSVDLPADLTEPDLREHLIMQAQSSGDAPRPADIERVVQRVLRQRTMAENIEAMRQAGAEVEYHAVDVCDERAFSRLIAEVYSGHGRIDGIVHGAGVIRDKRIEEKSLEMFRTVFRTKVSGALTLTNSLRLDELKFLVMFSSVSGRFGNVGQCDYAAANEFLNKLAVQLNAQCPARVVAINWGPWDGGMVTGPLRELYASRGIGLLSVEEGVRCFLSELTRTDACAGEVVIGCDDSSFRKITAKR